MATAQEYYRQGYNCAEALVQAYNEQFGGNVPNCVASAFGGGMCCGDTCGAVVGALLALGAEKGRLEGTQKNESRPYTLAIMKALREQYGSLDCRDLKKNGVSCEEIIGAAYKELEQALASPQIK